MKVNHIPVAKLTQAIMDNGMVSAYMRFLTTVMPLPYTSNAGGRPNTASFIVKPGVLFFTRFAHDNSGMLGFGAVQFLYVLIPGGVAAGHRAADTEKTVTINDGIYTASQLKAMSYNEVSALLHLSE